mmetsp:Transcript_110251/g.343739  ORF Transcript_110251/g.343739 Transcript_110251/m.343739 type:complete len:370 (-) Transcript_110251:708-1817(-)
MVEAVLRLLLLEHLRVRQHPHELFHDLRRPRDGPEHEDAHRAQHCVCLIPEHLLPVDPEGVAEVPQHDAVDDLRRLVDLGPPFDGGPEGEGEDLDRADQHHEGRPEDLPGAQGAELRHDLTPVLAFQVPSKGRAVVASCQQRGPTSTGGVVRIVLHPQAAHLAVVLQVQQRRLPARKDEEARRLRRLQHEAARARALQIPHRATAATTDLDGKARDLRLVHVQSPHVPLSLPVDAQGRDAGRARPLEVLLRLPPARVVVERGVAADPDPARVDAPHGDVHVAFGEEQAAVRPVRDGDALQRQRGHLHGPLLARRLGEVLGLALHVQSHQLRALHAPQMHLLLGARDEASLAVVLVLPHMLDLKDGAVVL